MITPIGQRIKELREAKKYTRACFAEKVGISIKFLYEIETGKKGFSADVLCKIADALSVSCDFIMYGKESSYEGRAAIIHILDKMDSKEIAILQGLMSDLGEICKELLTKQNIK